MYGTFHKTVASNYVYFTMLGIKKVRSIDFKAFFLSITTKLLYITIY